jgi:hypothetical protein
MASGSYVTTLPERTRPVVHHGLVHHGPPLYLPTSRVQERDHDDSLQMEYGSVQFLAMDSFLGILTRHTRYHTPRHPSVSHQQLTSGMEESDSQTPATEIIPGFPFPVVYFDLLLALHTDCRVE